MLTAVAAMAVACPASVVRAQTAVQEPAQEPLREPAAAPAEVPAAVPIDVPAAEEPMATEELPPPVADGTGDASPELTLDEITVTATRTGQPVDSALSGSSVLDRGTVQTETQATRVSDFLELVPGVTTSETAGDQASAINIRGLQDFGRVNVMIDGARQNFQTSGHGANGVFYFDPEMLGSVDVTRGPVSTIYGSGAIGGVVQFNTLTADDVLLPGQNQGGRFKTLYATNGNQLLEHGEVAARIGDTFDVVAAATGSTADSYSDGYGHEVYPSWNDLASALFKTRVRPTEDQEITASALLYNNWFDVGTSTIRRTSAQNGTVTVGYNYTPLDDPRFDVHANVYLNTTDTRQEVVEGTDLGATRNFNLVTTGFDVFNTSRFEAYGTLHALTYGVDGFHDSVENWDSLENADKQTPSGNRSVYGGFVQDEITLGMLQLIPAVRLDGYDLTGGGVSNTGGRLSPKITLGVTPIEQLTVFATYAEAWRAPAITETLINGVHPAGPNFEFLPNPNLKPEVAHEIEGGVNVRLDDTFVKGDIFRMKVVGYYNVVDDYIGMVYVPITPRPPPTEAPYAVQYQNFTRVKLWGGEVEAQYDMGLVFANIAGQIVRGYSEDTNRQLATIPADRVIGTLGFRALEDRLTAGVRLALYDQIEDPPPGYLAMSGYSVVDLFAAYTVNERITTNLEVNNLFNTQYRQYLDINNSPGLNAKFAVTIRL